MEAPQCSELEEPVLHVAKRLQQLTVEQKSFTSISLEDHHNCYLDFFGDVQVLLHVTAH